MIVRYRVSIAGIKGFARVYELRSDMTLYDFHKIMRDDLDFSHDLLIQFKALDPAGSLVARYGMFDLGYGSVDKVTLQDTIKAEVASFVYFYDVTNRKSLVVTYEGTVDEVPSREYPALVETKGPNPIEFENGYVAYEDLPEDQRHMPTKPNWDNVLSDDDSLDADLGDDDADEEEDDDDEEGKVIYDENEE